MLVLDSRPVQELMRNCMYTHDGIGCDVCKVETAQSNQVCQCTATIYMHMVYICIIFVGSQSMTLPIASVTHRVRMNSSVLWIVAFKYYLSLR